MRDEQINDVLNAGMTAKQISEAICGHCDGTGQVLVNNGTESDTAEACPQCHAALTDAEIAAACAASFEQMIASPDATAARMFHRDIVRAIHKYGFHDGGMVASERGAAVLEVLLRASERCLKHFDKIRPTDREPSQMVEELRKAIAICRGQ